MKRRVFIIIVCAAILSLMLAGCASARDKKVDLPEAASIESIQLKFCDDSCTVTDIVDIKDDNKNVITDLIKSSCGKWDESVNDNPQEVPYVVINIHTENQEEDRAVFVYEKNMFMKKTNTIMLNSHMQVSGLPQRNSMIWYTTTLIHRSKTNNNKNGNDI